MKCAVSLKLKARNTTRDLRDRKIKGKNLRIGSIKKQRYKLFIDPITSRKKGNGAAYV